MEPRQETDRQGGQPTAKAASRQVRQVRQGLESKLILPAASP